MSDFYDSVILQRDYGKVQINIRDIMKSKGISRNKLACLAGIRFEVADRFYSGNISRLDLDVLAKILFVLQCDINDVLFYQKPHQSQNE